MTLPRGYSIPYDGNNVVYWLQNSIYDLKQASKTWYERLKRVLLDIGLLVASVAQCLFVKDVSTKHFTKIGVYVDDIIVESWNLTAMEEKKAVLAAVFEISDLGLLQLFRGIFFVRDDKIRRVLLSQEL